MDTETNDNDVTFLDWLKELQGDILEKYGEEDKAPFPNENLREFWRNNWDLELIESFIAWRDYDPI